jgi:hypothetical protein
MADPSSTVLFDLDVDQCYKILDDVISHILSSSQDKTEKPSPFLEKYFQDVVVHVYSYPGHGDQGDKRK